MNKRVGNDWIYISGVRGKICVAFILSLFVFSLAIARPAKRLNYPPKIPGARALVYKNAGHVELRVWIMEPKGHKADDRQATIVFFFGGGWSVGSPEQFVRQSRYLARRGMVAIMADYRVLTRHGAKIKICVSDVKSAIRWVRKESSTFDCSRIK